MKGTYKCLPEIHISDHSIFMYKPGLRNFWPNPQLHLRIQVPGRASVDGAGYQNPRASSGAKERHSFSCWLFALHSFLDLHRPELTTAPIREHHPMLRYGTSVLRCLFTVPYNKWTSKIQLIFLMIQAFLWHVRGRRLQRYSFCYQ